MRTRRRYPTTSHPQFAHDPRSGEALVLLEYNNFGNHLFIYFNFNHLFSHLWTVYYRVYHFAASHCGAARLNGPELLVVASPKQQREDLDERRKQLSAKRE